MSNKIFKNIIISSTIKIARNFSDINFDSNSNIQNSNICLTRVRDFIAEKASTELQLNRLNKKKLQQLIIEGVVDEKAFENPQNSYLFIVDNIKILVNGINHVCFYISSYGKSISFAYRKIKKIVDDFDNKYNAAKNKNLFILSSPNLCGTGAIFSVKLHLPITSLFANIQGKLLTNDSKNMFVISNDKNYEYVYSFTNLNSNYDNIDTQINCMQVLILQFILKEIQNRRKYFKMDLNLFKDKINKAINIAKYAKYIDENEIRALYSFFRMACELDIVGMNVVDFDKLFLKILLIFNTNKQRSINDKKRAIYIKKYFISKFGGNNVGF